MSTLRVDNLQGQTAGTDRYVVQVVSSNLTTHFNSNSQTFHDITGLSLSITPASTNNKVLIMVNMYPSGS